MLQFSQSFTACVGENGQGKTNLLESIVVLALGKSLRVPREEVLVREGEHFFRIVGTLTTDAGEVLHAEVVAQVVPRLTKICKINTRVTPLSRYVGRIPVVSFFPEDLNLLLLEPARRRHYMDVVLSQGHPEYLVHLSRYLRAVRQRNALLCAVREGMAGHDALESWDRELAQHGAAVHAARIQGIAALAPRAADRYRRIAERDDALTLLPLHMPEESATPAGYLAALQACRARDIAAGHTTFGAHRGDMQVLLRGQAVTHTASRGEVRSCVLALKFAELEYLHAARSERPLLLLDDVYSELDRSRQQHLMQQIAGYQTFITTTKREHVDGCGAEMALYNVVAGRVARG